MTIQTSYIYTFIGVYALFLSVYLWILRTMFEENESCSLYSIIKKIITLKVLHAFPFSTSHISLHSYLFTHLEGKKLEWMN